MKKILISLTLTLRILTVAYTQHSIEEFYVHDEENIFYLLMPVSEIHRMLGTPIEEIKVVREHFHRVNYIILKYPGLEFIYFDSFDDPEILMITFIEDYKLGNINLIGRNEAEILKKYGEPVRSIESSEYLYLRYEFNLNMPHHLVLQFRFNSLGTCDEVSLIHSLIYI